MVACQVLGLRPSGLMCTQTPLVVGRLRGNHASSTMVRMEASWNIVAQETVPQYKLMRYGGLSVVSKGSGVEDVVVAGYASPQVPDRERHVITKKALAKDLPRFMAHPHYRNANLLHSNVTVGEVLPRWTNPKTGEVYETKVDDVGLFAVVKVRTDPHRPPIVDKVISDIESGKLASFSISADAPFESRRHECHGGSCFWIIDEVVLYEITLCETPVNPDAKFAMISKSYSEAGEFAASAFCKDGSCPMTIPQAEMVLKGSYGSASGRMLFDKGDEDETVEVAGLAVIAQDTGRVLMVQRALTGDDPAAGTWEFPGGHVEEGEQPFDAAKREWEEETGCFLPEGKRLGEWRSEDGVYLGIAFSVPDEAAISIHDDRDDVINPDDPDGDITESLAWWDPDHLEDNPALRDELKPQVAQVREAISSVVDKHRDSMGSTAHHHTGGEAGPGAYKPMPRRASLTPYSSRQTYPYKYAGDPVRLRPQTREMRAPKVSDWSDLELSKPDQFDEGLERESAEHFETVDGDLNVIAGIVRDHLEEDPLYYNGVEEEEGKPYPKAGKTKLSRGKTATGQEVIDFSPRTTEGGGEADRGTETQYLNLGQSARSYGSGIGLEIVNGEDDVPEPVHFAKIRAPRVTPRTTTAPTLLKALSSVLLRAASASTDLVLARDARAAGYSLGQAFPMVAWLEKSYFRDVAVVPDPDGPSPASPFVPIGALLSALKKGAIRARDGKLANELGLMESRVQRTRPMTEGQGKARLDQIIKASLDFALPLGPTTLLKASKESDPFEAARLLQRRLARAAEDAHISGELDPLVAAAVEVLNEDAQAVLDGMKLGTYVRVGKDPEIEILEKVDSVGTLSTVEKTDEMLNQLSKAEVEKGSPDNLPPEFAQRAIEAAPDQKAAPDRKGIMVAWYPPSGMARQMAQEGGEVADDLHITVLYVTDDATTIQPSAVEALRQVMGIVASKNGPLNGSLSGVGRFNGTDGKVPVVALADVPGLSDLRTDILREVELAGVKCETTHGFQPHMTLRYDPPGMDDMQERGIPQIETTPISIDKLCLVIGDQRETFELRPVTVDQPQRDGEKAVTALRIRKGDTTVEIS